LTEGYNPHIERCVTSKAPTVAVYFIQSTETGNVKIGWSKNPTARLATLQTAHAYPLRLLRVSEGA